MVTNRFFIPDEELIQSIVEYADNRLIVDVGCANGDLLEELHSRGAKCVGVEPYFIDYLRILKLLEKSIHIFPDTIENTLGTFKEIFNNSLILFARPCHSSFIINTLNILKNMYIQAEVMYISLEENLDKYEDLGLYESKFKRIKLNGSSIDNEIIMVL